MWNENISISEELYNKYKKIMKTGWCTINCSKFCQEQLERHFGYNPTISWNYSNEYHQLEIENILKTK